MFILAKAYCQHMPHNIPFNHCRGPPNLQNPISLFAITSPSSPSSVIPADPNPHDSINKPQFGHFVIPTIAIAASAWFFIRLHRSPPIITAPIDLQFESEEEEEGAIKEVPLKQKPNYVRALHMYRVKQGTVVKLIEVYEKKEYEALKERIRTSAEWLERARRGLEEVVPRDPGRAREYSQVVEELMEILKEMEVYIEKCEKENVKGYLRPCNRLLSRVRRMEAQILDVLKEFQDSGGRGRGQRAVQALADGTGRRAIILTGNQKL
ncbi:PREDICTED: uncharacterized protein LOC104814084 [Tarenaya hassleriana]|uniref:uncharacterized protein LOC104814084 n=1 Tax=Tarenaya hassleriana TaxID=28532 RepID=UPI00053C20F3|nr:PREDICTED: uncharacterized protein LOC104814084 [Tarenaya hassleriana]